MQKFKIVASKSSKKYNLILTSESEIQARERLHKEGYSILSIKIADEKEIQGTKFVFHVISGEGVKKGIIIWEDIFKAYVKLKKDLGYDVKYIYPEGDESYLDDEKKTRIIHDLEQGYKIKIESKKQIIVKEKEDITATKEIDNSFYLKKELDTTHELIEHVLQKLQPIVDNQKDYKLSPEKIEKLRVIYNNITKLKKSTNTNKLREVGELALMKIGNIELSSLEWEKTKASKDLLKETNGLLRKIGSWKQFHEKSKDINYILGNFISKIEKSIFWKKENNLEKKVEKKDLIDKESYSFLKTLLLLEKYTEKLKKSNSEILKNITSIVLPFGKNIEVRDKLLIRRKVITQNIALLKAKKTWSIGSYTAVVKWYNKVFWAIGEIFRSISRVLLYVVVFYSFLFVTYLWGIKLGYTPIEASFHYQGILYFLVIILLVVLGNISRGVLMFFINFVFLFFIFIFSVVNF